MFNILLILTWRLRYPQKREENINRGKSYAKTVSAFKFYMSGKKDVFFQTLIIAFF